MRTRTRPVDASCNSESWTGMTRPPESKTMEAEIEEIKGKKEKAIKNQDFEGAAQMRDKEKQAKEKMESMLKEWRTKGDEKRIVVGEEVRGCRAGGRHRSGCRCGTGGTRSW